MKHMSQKTTRNLTLTEEEALALLEICLHTKAEDDALKVRVMHKVGDVCREFIKASENGPSGLPLHADRPSVREALDTFIHLRSTPESACA